jgi:hypothetical protein
MSSSVKKRSSTFTFTPVVVRIGEYEVEWVYLNEGLSGEYRPEDPHDVPCLRFICRFRDILGSFVRIDKGSYLTELPVTTGTDKLLVAAQRLLEILRESQEGNTSLVESLRLMSHLSPLNFELHPATCAWPTKAFRSNQ